MIIHNAHCTIHNTANETLVAGAWTEREKMYHGGSFLKLADDNMDIQNPEAQNRELGGFSAEKVTFPHSRFGHFQCPKQKSETTFQYKYTPY